MRRLASTLALLSVVCSSGCTYSAIQQHNGKLYVTRNDFPMFGVRKIYECTAVGDGNLTCVKLEGRP